jgi:hypothetical protein
VFLALVELRGAFPFPIGGLDCDDGSESVNAHLLAYCEQEELPSPARAWGTRTTAHTWSRRTGRWCVAPWAAAATTPRPSSASSSASTRCYDWGRTSPRLPVRTPTARRASMMHAKPARGDLDVRQHGRPVRPAVRWPWLVPLDEHRWGAHFHGVLRQQGPSHVRCATAVNCKVLPLQMVKKTTDIKTVSTVNIGTSGEDRCDATGTQD